MKVIVMKDVPHLGEEGDIREVATGYARNYLLPKKLAVLYDKASLHIITQKRKAFEKKKEEKRTAATSLKEKLEQVEIAFVHPAGENGKLFGAITGGHIADELAKQGFQIEKKKIIIPDHHIKLTGNYKIRIKLYENEEAEIKVSVTAEEAKQS
jgi:large subunit ribosomal protein L9